MEQKARGRSRVKLAVIVVLAVHVLFLGPLLMQGCKREQKPVTTAETPTLPPLEPSTIDPTQATNVPAPAPEVTPPHVVPVPAVPAAGTTEYTVVKGDSFYALGKKFGVSMKAIADANPGVDSSKLKLGQKLIIPSPAAAAAPGAANGVVAPAADGESVYAVKSGDNLSKIAAAHGTTIKALKSLNQLTTDRIKVGQKLKLPAPKAAAPPAGLPVPSPTTTPPAN